MPEVSAVRLAIAVVAGVAVAVAVAATDTSPVPMPVLATAPPPSPSPPELTAQIELPRLIRDPRTVAVLVTNHGRDPVWVRDVELVSDSFAPTGPVEKGVPIAAGAAKALAVVYGEPRCGGEAAPSLALATARLVVASGAEPPADSRWLTVTLPLAHAQERLGLRLRAECAAQAVAAAADLRLVEWSPGPDGRLHGTLTVTRRAGDDPIIVHRLTGSSLYALAAEPGAGELGRLEPGQDRLAVPVVADAARCDGHAMADVKFPFRFRVWVTVGEVVELSTTAALDPAAEPRFDEMWQVRCG